MLSREATGRDGSEQEVNWSLGAYLTPSEVQKAFNLPQTLPQPTNVAPNQPFLHKRVYLLAAIFLAIFLVIAAFFSAPGTRYWMKRFRSRRRRQRDRSRGQRSPTLYSVKNLS